jgi:hypothetical protein
LTNLVYNIALGRVAELYNRVDLNDPATATMVVAILATSGLEADNTLRDKVTFADLVSGTTNEVTNTNYVRKIWTDTDIAAFAPDQSGDQVLLAVAVDPTWTSVLTGDGWSRLVICYDATSTGVTATAMIPLTHHDFVVVPDGSNITAQLASTGFFRAVSST